MYQNVKLHTNKTDATDDHGLYIIDEQSNFTVRNMQYMVQFFNEYNQELTMIKRAVSPIAKSVISQLDEYNFTLPIKHLD